MISRRVFSLTSLFIGTTIILLVLPGLIHAQTKTVSPAKSKVSTTVTATVTKGPDQNQETINKLKQIELLKEKIATRVAQIRESEKGGFAGVIKKIALKLIFPSDLAGWKIGVKLIELPENVLAMSSRFSVG